MTISAELQGLKTDGLIDARKAVAWARENPASALYGALDWDDEHAAEEHRVWQVRRLIAIHVVDTSGGRAVVSLSIDRKEGGYRPVEDVLKRQDWRAIMLSDALADLKRVQQRYDRLTELDRVWSEVRRVESVKTPRGRRKAA